MANLKIAATNEIKIDKDFPIPSARRHAKWPWSELEVGDSFVHTGRFGYEAARTASQRLAPKKFRAAVCDDGFRIWRIK